MHACLVEEGKRIRSFDTLKFAKGAECAGFTKQQAEFQAEEIAKVIDENLTTNEDLKLVREEVKLVGLSLEKTKIEFKADLELIRYEVKSMENKIVVKVGAMMVVAIGVLATIIKLF